MLRDAGAGAEDAVVAEVESGMAVDCAAPVLSPVASLRRGWPLESKSSSENRLLSVASHAARALADNADMVFQERSLQRFVSWQRATPPGFGARVSGGLRGRVGLAVRWIAEPS